MFIASFPKLFIHLPKYGIRTDKLRWLEVVIFLSDLHFFYIECRGKLYVIKGMIFIGYSLIAELGATVISKRYPKVHAANGQEYARVYIDHDVAASLSRPGGVSANQFGDEANIGYVAFTRAMRDLYLPQP